MYNIKVQSMLLSPLMIMGYVMQKYAPSKLDPPGTTFGCQKWSQVQFWHPKPVPVGQGLAAKIGPLLPKVILWGDHV